jgi:3-methylcrotonyl-CoA carboxylase alpha subunit
MTVYQVAIGDRTLRVELSRAASGVLVSVDGGEPRSASFLPVHGALYALQLGPHTQEVMALVAGDDVRLTVGGREIEATVVDEAHARLAAVAGAHGVAHARRELKAPMPGLLVKMLAQPGDTIEAGQPLAVLQAMKMENELSLPYAGTVREVRAQAGQTVEQGQPLIVVDQD